MGGMKPNVQGCAPILLMNVALLVRFQEPIPHDVELVGCALVLCAPLFIDECGGCNPAKPLFNWQIFVGMKNASRPTGFGVCYVVGL